MSIQLNNSQKMKINRLLKSNQKTPADETIGDTIKKCLRLSDEQYRELDEQINAYVEKFFDDMMG